MFHDVSVVPMANMTLFFVAGVTAGLRPLLSPPAPTNGTGGQVRNVPVAGG